MRNWSFDDLRNFLIAPMPNCIDVPRAPLKTIPSVVSTGSDHNMSDRGSNDS